jgi:hypothetical protein
MNIVNPFIYIRNKHRVISSEGFSALEKKHHDMFSEVNAAHLIGWDSPLQIVIAVWHTVL